MDHAPLRRRFLKVAAATCAAGLGFSAAADRRSPIRAASILDEQTDSDADAKPRRFTLGFSLYGMNGLPLAEAIEACAKIGYRDIEPALMPGYSADPEQLSKPRRAELRRQIDGLGLNFSAVMENLPALAPADKQSSNIDRIARAAELAHDLAPAAGNRAAGAKASTPIMETVLGGKPDEWNTVRGRILDTLKLWSAAGEKHDLIIAVKAHVANALHTPTDLHELVREIGSPRLKAAFDYSHFERQGFNLDESMRAVIGDTVFVHVKDGRGIPPNFQFLLPGDGTTNYVEMFRKLDSYGYRGSVTVEVSGQIFKQPGYDPIAAATKCYRHLKKAYDESAD